MALNNIIKTNQKATAVTALAGAAPQTGAGNTLSMVAQNVETGTLSARVYAQATTNTLTIAAKWQVSTDNGTTWIDAAVPQNPANVVMVTGTGSAVPSTKSIDAPAGVYGHSLVRCAVVTAVASATTGDEFQIAYNYRERRGNR